MLKMVRRECETLVSDTHRLIQENSVLSQAADDSAPSSAVNQSALSSSSTVLRASGEGFVENRVVQKLLGITPSVVDESLTSSTTLRALPRFPTVEYDASLPPSSHRIAAAVTGSRTAGGRYALADSAPTVSSSLDVSSSSVAGRRNSSGISDRARPDGLMSPIKVNASYESDFSDRVRTARLHHSQQPHSKTRDSKEGVHPEMVSPNVTYELIRNFIGSGVVK